MKRSECVDLVVWILVQIDEFDPEDAWNTSHEIVEMLERIGFSPPPLKDGRREWTNEDLESFH